MAFRVSTSASASRGASVKSSISPRGAQRIASVKPTGARLRSDIAEWQQMRLAMMCRAAAGAVEVEGKVLQCPCAAARELLYLIGRV